MRTSRTLSICIAVKNRSRVRVDGRELLLFPNCIRSVVESVAHDLPCELVVTDWASDDWPLEQWLERAAAPLPVRILQESGGFSRGRGLNAAAAVAQGNLLLFTDADSLLSRGLIESGIRYIEQGKAFFPVLYSFDTPEHGTGWWRHEGFGNCMMSRSVFEQAGRWPEYPTWGKEDDHFFASVSRVAPVVREEVRGFYHQWHPEDVEWKDRYADVPHDVREERRQARLAAAEIATVVPAGGTLVLVDEARFGIDEIDGRRALPFTESAGEYAGPPGDDAAAVRELERMRSMGATFLAVAFPAFWWLDYYAQFREHLESTYRCAWRSDRLIIFDLRDRARIMPAEQTALTEAPSS